MKALKPLLPYTKFYNFSRKFWQVAALSWTFFGEWGPQGPEISLGPRPPPLGTASAGLHTFGFFFTFQKLTRWHRFGTFVDRPPRRRVFIRANDTAKSLTVFRTKKIHVNDVKHDPDHPLRKVRNVLHIRKANNSEKFIETLHNLLGNPI